jgi:hypothetical protein
MHCYEITYDLFIETVKINSLLTFCDPLFEISSCRIHECFNKRLKHPELTVGLIQNTLHFSLGEYLDLRGMKWQMREKTS